MAGVKIKRAKGGDRETTGSPIMRNCGCDFETELTVWHAMKCPPFWHTGFSLEAGTGLRAAAAERAVRGALRASRLAVRLGLLLLFSTYSPEASERTETRSALCSPD